MVQPVRPWGRRSAVRFGGNAAVCGHRSGAGAGAGRNHGVQVPPSAGTARFGRADVRASGRTFAAEGTAPERGNDRGRDHHQRSEFDQECPPRAGSGDAPDAQGQAVVFRDEGARGVDSQTKLIHSVVATAANAADCTMLPHLLHGAETRVWGDQAYRGQGEVLREHAPRALDFTNQRYRYKHHIDEVEREKNRTKSSVRSKVQHVFAVMKLKFGFVKVRYRGLDKNANRLFVTCALVNLFMVRKRLLTATA